MLKFEDIATYHRLRQTEFMLQLLDGHMPANIPPRVEVISDEGASGTGIGGRTEGQKEKWQVQSYNRC